LGEATAQPLLVAALWANCADLKECVFSVLVELGPYFFTYLVVNVSLILVSIILHKLLEALDGLAYRIYDRRLSRGSLKDKTRVAQWCYLVRRGLFRLQVLSFVGFIDPPNDFQRLKAGGVARVTESLVRLLFFPFRLSLSNLFAWSVVMVIRRPPFPSTTEIKVAIDHVWNTDWGKLLPWLALLLSLTAYRRIFNTKARLRFKEKNADRAFELAVRLANALSSIQDSSDRNIPILLKDLQYGRLQALWCSEVTGNDIWTVEKSQVSVARGPNLLPANLHYCLYYSPGQAELGTVNAVVESMEEERLWSFWIQLWPRIAFDLSQLHLLRTINPDHCGESFLHSARIRSIIEVDARACAERLKTDLQDAEDDLARIESPAWMINRYHHETPAVLELGRRLGDESTSFSRHVHRRIGQSIYAGICTDRVVNTILSYEHSSRIERALLWVVK
jgi:CRISPR/Cas system-associated endoribonuclease Cas2